MNRASRWLIVLFLAALAAGSIHLKTRQSVSLPRYDPEDETGYFRAESAAQYRYARLVASGAGIPGLDREAQYPEGIRTRRELFLAMEKATGWTWRLLDRFIPLRDLRWFTLIWSALIASLAVPALYLIAGRLSGCPPLSLAAAAVFACSWAGMANGIGTYGFESFALPMLLLSLAFLAAGLDRAEKAWRGHAFAAGALLAAGLTSWHFARFHLAALWLALAWAGWRCRGDREALDRLRACLAILLGFALAAGLLSVPLRHGGFAIAPTMAVGYALLLSWSLPLRALFPALAAVGALTLANWQTGEPAAYGHVYGLLWEKLSHGLVKPADPALLSPDARLLWVGPFQSPEPGFILFALVPLAGIVLPRLAAFFARPAAEEAGQGSRAAASLVDALLVLYLIGTALVARLTPVLAFLLCAGAARLPSRWLKPPWLTAAFFLLASLEGIKSLAPASPLNPFLRLSAAWSGPERHPAGSFSNELALIRGLREHGRGRPVLANYGLSASLLTYAGSPILLQPKFEAPGIRVKVRDYLRALYGTEAEFAAFCRKHGAQLFVYSVEDILDETPDGPRYASGALRLKPDAAAVLFHFHPERLQRFALTYENPGFRVFAVSDNMKQGPPRPRDPVYDIDRYSPEIEDGFLRLDVAGVNQTISQSRRYLLLARILARMGRGEDALAAYTAAFAAWPPDAKAKEEATRLRTALEQDGR